MHSIDFTHSPALNTPIRMDKDLKDQFSRLPISSSNTTHDGDRRSYRNRYPDVKPYDNNRVRLRDPEFYFNASWVLDGTAIASQGPMETEVHEFWKMIWEKDCSLIVMLTDLHYEEKEKCAMYWTEEADTKSFFFDVLQEEILYEERDSEVKIIKRIIEVEQNEKIKTFTQLHLVNWNDGDVVSPETLGQLVRFADQERKREGPLLAHCSAGVGRTGTFLAAYGAFYKRLKGVFEIAGSLRDDRIGMIQTLSQYILAQRTVDLLPLVTI